MSIGRLRRHLDDDAVARVLAGIKPIKKPKQKRTSAPRERGSYRAARRNEALRGETKTTWGPDYYYEAAA